MRPTTQQYYNKQQKKDYCCIIDEINYCVLLIYNVDFNFSKKKKIFKVLIVFQTH